MFNKKLRRKMFFNRQPTLHRHGAPFVEVVPIEDSENGTIALNPLSLEPLNADFDGDLRVLLSSDTKIESYELLEYLKRQSAANIYYVSSTTILQGSTLKRVEA